MADSASPLSGKTGLTLAVTLSKNGAAFGAAAGTVTETAGGNYYLTPTSADTGTLGPLNVRATASGAVDFNTVKQVVAFDPYAATNLGLTNLDAAISTRSTYAGGNIAGITGLTIANNGVNLNLSQAGCNASRLLDSVTDTTATINDGLHSPLIRRGGRPPDNSTIGRPHQQVGRWERPPPPSRSPTASPGSVVPVKEGLTMLVTYGLSVGAIATAGLNEAQGTGPPRTLVYHYASAVVQATGKPDPSKGTVTPK